MLSAPGFQCTWPTEVPCCAATDKRIVSVFPLSRLCAWLCRFKLLFHCLRLRDALGEHGYKAFVRAKRREWDEYRLQVSQWEWNRYFEVV